MFSYSFLSEDICYNIFKDIFQRIDKISNNAVFNNKMVDEEEFSPLMEWLLISIAKYLAEDDEYLEAIIHRNIQSLTPQTASMYSNLRVDALAVAVLIKHLYPVKYTIFSIQTGLYELRGSNSLLFDKHY